jgi:hypothetical protein
VATKRLCHLYVVAIWRGDEIGTDKKQNEIRPSQGGVDLLCKIPAGSNPSVMPEIDDALALQTREMDVELPTRFFVVAADGVGSRIRTDYFGHPGPRPAGRIALSVTRIRWGTGRVGGWVCE